MEHTFTEVAPCRQRLELSFTEKEVDDAIDAVFVEYNHSTKFKGFRPGRAPRRMIERKYGSAVGRDAAIRLVQDALKTAMDEAKFNPLGDPDVDTEKMTVKAGEPFIFTLELDIRPDITLGEYVGLTLKDEIVEASEAAIDERLEQLRKNMADFNPITEPTQKEDLLEVDAKMTAGDEEIVNVTDHRLRVEGTELFGIPCPDLEEKLVGVQAGAEIVFEQTIPADHPRENLRGQTAKTVVTVKGARRPKLPEINDEFATRMGYSDGLGALRARIRLMLNNERSNQRRENLERQISDQLVEAHPMPLPDEFVKRQTNAQLYQNRLRLARMGATKEFLTENAGSMESATRQGVERGLRWSIVSDAIAEKEKIEINTEEITEYIDALARQQRTTREKLARTISDNNGMMSVAAEIRDAKVYTWLIEKAKIEKVEPSAAAPKTEA